MCLFPISLFSWSVFLFLRVAHRPLDTLNKASTAESCVVLAFRAQRRAFLPTLLVFQLVSFSVAEIEPRSRGFARQWPRFTSGKLRFTYTKTGLAHLQMLRCRQPSICAGHKVGVGLSYTVLYSIGEWRTPYLQHTVLTISVLSCAILALVYTDCLY